MYQVRRLISYVINKHSDWEEHIIKKTNTVFNLTDEEFDFLSNLKQEYDYILVDNILCIDRNPTSLENYINNDFVQDYAANIGRKFYVLYEYKKIENV